MQGEAGGAPTRSERIRSGRIRSRWWRGRATTGAPAAALSTERERERVRERERGEGRTGERKRGREGARRRDLEVPAIVGGVAGGGDEEGAWRLGRALSIP